MKLFKYVQCFSLVLIITFQVSQAIAQDQITLPCSDFQVQMLSPKGGEEDVELEDLTLEWSKNPCARSYKVTIATDSRFTQKVFEEIAPASDAELKIAKGTLRANTTYFWKVVAMLNSGEESQPQSKFSHFFTSGSILQSFSKARVHLQRSLAGPDKAEAAQFSFVNKIGKKPSADPAKEVPRTIFNTEFALYWNSKTKRIAENVDLSFMPSVEAALTNDTEANANAWRVKSALVLDAGSDTTGTYTSIGLLYETDRQGNTKKLMFDTIFTPTYTPIAIGLKKPNNVLDGGVTTKERPIQFRWRPFFGFAAGRTIKVGDSKETEENLVRVSGRIRAELFLNFLKRPFRFTEAKIYADNSLYGIHTNSSQSSFNDLVSGLELLVSENIAIELTYRSGNPPPRFQRVHSWAGGIGIRF